MQQAPLLSLRHDTATAADVPLFCLPSFRQCSVVGAAQLSMLSLVDAVKPPTHSDHVCLLEDLAKVFLRIRTLTRTHQCVPRRPTVDLCR